MKNKAWVWDYVDGGWRSCRKEDIYPGQTILVAHSTGGYDVKMGWTGEAGDREFSGEHDGNSQKPITAMPMPPSSRKPPASAIGKASPCMEHTLPRVIADIVGEVSLPEDLAAVLGTGARWHDVGKGHPAFQGCILPDAVGHPRTDRYC